MEIVAVHRSDQEKRLLEHYFDQHGSPADDVDFVPQKDTLIALRRRRSLQVLVFVSEDSDQDLNLIYDFLPLLQSSLLLVIGPTINAKFVLKIQNIPNARYIDVEELDRELARILLEHRTASLASNPGRVISVLSLSGGCGATTLSVGCVVELAKSQDGVALIDLCLESGDAAPLLDLRPNHSVADFCRNVARMDETMFSQCFTRHSSGVDLLAAPLRFTSIRDVTVEGVEYLLSMARHRYPYVLIDLRNDFSQLVSKVLNESDLIVCVMRQDFTSLRHASRVLGFIEDQGIPESRLAFVTSRIGQSGEIALKEIEEALKLKACVSIPEDPKSVNWATNHGDPVVSSRPHSPASRAIKRVLDRIETMTR